MNIDLNKYSKKHSPSYVIDIYNNGKEYEIVFGNRQIKPNIKKCDDNTLYDIASLTKIYTATLIYIAYEENKINIYDFVKNIDDRFANLDDICVVDLLSHNQEIWTDGYLGNAVDKDEFYKILFSATIKNKIPTYVDSHYIILSTLLEKVYNKTYTEILNEKIIHKLNLEKTTVNPKTFNIASNNYETLNGEIINIITPGLLHDNKARRAKELGIITGHASIFTTGKELLKFLKTFFDYTLLKKETIFLMLTHEDRNRQNYEILNNIVIKKDINLMYNEALEINKDLNLMKTYNYMGTRYEMIFLN